MKQRVVTGALIVLALLIFVALRFLNTYIFDALIGIICICSVFEVSKVLNNANFYNNKVIALIFPLTYYIAFIICTQNTLPIWCFFLVILGIILLLSLITLLCTLFSKNTLLKEKGELTKQKYVVKKILTTMFLLIYPSLILCTLFILNHAGEICWFSTKISANLGLMLLIMLFSVTMMTDTFAYFVGSLLKGPKLCPKISPKKTISGAIGGLLGGLFASLIFFFVARSIPFINEFFTQINAQWWQFMIYGIIGSIFTQIGDIFASLLKRKAKTKDFSSIFPGHGGFMDRCDGLSFNAMVTFIFAILLFI